MLDSRLEYSESCLTAFQRMDFIHSPPPPPRSKACQTGGNGIGEGELAEKFAIHLLFYFKEQFSRWKGSGLSRAERFLGGLGIEARRRKKTSKCMGALEKVLGNHGVSNDRMTMLLLP